MIFVRLAFDPYFITLIETKFNYKVMFVIFKDIISTNMFVYRFHYIAICVET